MTTVDPKELLDQLRAVPPIGSWGVLGTTWDDRAREWVPDGCRPSKWYDTRELAEDAVRNSIEPAFIARVIAVPGGWSTGPAIEVDRRIFTRQPSEGTDDEAFVLAMYTEASNDGDSLTCSYLREAYAGWPHLLSLLDTVDALQRVMGRLDEARMEHGE
jgi:hypothetical protein